jgi:DNA polymerase-3 subunit gamma/tau
MAYTVLARKYRSQTFDDVIGQDPISQTLKNAIKTGRVAHAFLFSGTRGVGKTTMARILAKALNCHSSDAPTTEPCCKCDSCIAVNAGEDIDVIEIDGATNNGVEEVRRLRQNAIYRPARSRNKIYIIDEVHMLSTSAFNALLKTLEEPPDHVKFIFATTEPNKVIATIQSRCQRFDFNNITPAHIAGHLKSLLEQEKIKYEEDLILPLAKMANGSMRDGLSLLDRLISTGVQPLSAKLLEQFLGCADSEKIYNLIETIGGADAAASLTAVEALINAGLSEVQIVDALVDYMRDLMVVKAASADSQLLILTQQQRQRVSQLAEKFDIAALVYSITTLEKLRWTIKNSETARALLDACILRFALSEHFMNVDELASQISGNRHPAAAVKKKRLTDTTPPPPLPQPTVNDLQDIKTNFQQIIAKLPPGTAGLLNKAIPSQLENNTLTITFPPENHINKKMCQETGRAQQIQTVLSEALGISITLKFELASDENSGDAKDTKSLTERKNEMVNDPAVKTVLMELNATVTGIEEI